MTRYARWFQTTSVLQAERDRVIADYFGSDPTADLVQGRDDAKRTQTQRRLDDIDDRVLEAFWSILVPLQVGEVVPARVAELLAKKHG